MHGKNKFVDYCHKSVDISKILAQPMECAWQSRVYSIPYLALFIQLNAIALIFSNSMREVPFIRSRVAFNTWQLKLSRTFDTHSHV